MTVIGFIVLGSKLELVNAVPVISAEQIASDNLRLRLLCLLQASSDLFLDIWLSIVFISCIFNQIERSSGIMLEYSESLLLSGWSSVDYVLQQESSTRAAVCTHAQTPSAHLRAQTPSVYLRAQTPSVYLHAQTPGVHINSTSPSVFIRASRCFHVSRTSLGPLEGHTRSKVK